MKVSRKDIYIFVLEIILGILIYLITKSFFFLNLSICAGILHRFIYDYSENNLPRVRMLFYLLFGGLATLSLLFHNPLFLKIKGALATLFVALFFIYSPKFMQRPALYYLLVHVQRFFKTDNKSVYEMNLATGVLFLLLTFLNIFVTLYCNTSTWLLLKTILTPVIVVSFIVIQYILYNK